MAGVALGIAALLWVRGDAPQGSPTVEPPVSLPTQQPTATTSAPPTAPPTTAPSATTAPVAEPTAVATTTAPLRAPVTVLNNSRRTGLAERAAARFRAAGWPVRQTGNYRGQLSQTTVYYPPGGEDVARAFAREFGVARVLPRFSTLPGTGLTVVLTREYQA